MADVRPHPIDTWVQGRIALLGDAAHPPPQYLAQRDHGDRGRLVLAEHAKRLRAADHTADRPGTLAVYAAVRREHCRRVVLTASGVNRLTSTEFSGSVATRCFARAVHDYSFTDRIYGPTALFRGTNRRCSSRCRSRPPTEFTPRGSPRRGTANMRCEVRLNLFSGIENS